MSSYTVTITDANKLAGITAAREAYNLSKADTPGFVPMATDQEYVQFVMDRAAQSYANQHIGSVAKKQQSPVK